MSGEERHDRGCAAGITNGAARCQCTPVPSEATEAGEGERCMCAEVNAISDPRLPSVSCPMCATPAEPDAGDVEALTDAEMEQLDKVLLYLWSTTGSRRGANGRQSQLDYGKRQARMAVGSILAARLDAVRRKAGDERAERIAQAIEAERETGHVAKAHGPHYRTALTDAARIARSR